MSPKIKSQIIKDLQQAVKEKKRPVISALRMFLAALKNEEIKKRSELKDKEIQTLLQREIKKIKESITAFKQGQREDLVAQEQASLEVLKKYLPPQLSEVEIKKQISTIIKDLGAGPKDFGRVMGEAMQRLQGQAEGQVVNKIVKKLLTDK